LLTAAHIGLATLQTFVHVLLHLLSLQGDPVATVTEYLLQIGLRCAGGGVEGTITHQQSLDGLRVALELMVT